MNIWAASRGARHAYRGCLFQPTANCVNLYLGKGALGCAARKPAPSQRSSEPLASSLRLMMPGLRFTTAGTLAPLVLPPAGHRWRMTRRRRRHRLTDHLLVRPPDIRRTQQTAETTTWSSSRRVREQPPRRGPQRPPVERDTLGRLAEVVLFPTVQPLPQKEPGQGRPERSLLAKPLRAKQLWGRPLRLRNCCSSRSSRCEFQCSWTHRGFARFRPFDLSMAEAP